jgi:hypothetical protein
MRDGLPNHGLRPKENQNRMSAQVNGSNGEVGLDGSPEFRLGGARERHSTGRMPEHGPKASVPNTAKSRPQAPRRDGQENKKDLLAAGWCVLIKDQEVWVLFLDPPDS